jgi:hypothetical protein
MLLKRNTKVRARNLFKRRGRRLAKTDRKKGWIKYFLIIFVVIIPYLFLKFLSRHWTGEDKLFLAINNGDGGVNVVSFNPVDSEIVNIHIPGNTQVEVAHQLGTWKVKSLWQLGKQEKLGGKLLASTITKNFKFPVFLWADSIALGFVTTEPVSLVKAVFTPYEGSLGLGDRIRLAIFSIGIKNSKRIDVELSQTSYLTETILKDGEVGFIISGNVPQKLTAVFSSDKFASGELRIRVRDKSDSPGVAAEVGRIVEVLGGKVSSISKEIGEDMSCSVSGRDKLFVEAIMALFPCELSGRTSDNFDLEMTIGRDFQKNF